MEWVKVFLAAAFVAVSALACGGTAEEGQEEPDTGQGEETTADGSDSEETTTPPMEEPPEEADTPPPGPGDPPDAEPRSVELGNGEWEEEYRIVQFGSVRSDWTGYPMEEYTEGQVTVETMPGSPAVYDEIGEELLELYPEHDVLVVNLQTSTGEYLHDLLVENTPGARDAYMESTEQLLEEEFAE